MSYSSFLCSYGSGSDPIKNDDFSGGSVMGILGHKKIEYMSTKYAIRLICPKCMVYGFELSQFLASGVPKSVEEKLI